MEERLNPGTAFGEILGMTSQRPGFPGLSALFSGRANGIRTRVTAVKGPRDGLKASYVEGRGIGIPLNCLQLWHFLSTCIHALPEVYFYCRFTVGDGSHDQDRSRWKPG